MENRVSTEPHIFKLGELKNQLVQELREYAKSQRDLWAQIPYLALQVWGRAKDKEGWLGFPEILSKVFSFGYWEIKIRICDWCLREKGSSLIPRDKSVNIFVDCATGELVDPDDPSKPASNEVVYLLASVLLKDEVHIDQDDGERMLRAGLDQLDAAWLIEKLQRKIATLPDIEFVDGTTGEKVLSEMERIRERFIQKLGLKPIYVRKQHFTAHERFLDWCKDQDAKKDLVKRWSQQRGLRAKAENAKNS